IHWGYFVCIPSICSKSFYPFSKSIVFRHPIQQYVRIYGLLCKKNYKLLYDWFSETLFHVHFFIFHYFFVLVILLFFCFCLFSTKLSIIDYLLLEYNVSKLV